MSRFEHVLRRLDAELETPEPWRSEALVEIGGDLEAAYAAYRARGLSEAEATLRAAAVLGPDGATARELSRLHTPSYARWLGGIASPRWERVALTVVTRAALAGSAAGLRGALTPDGGGMAAWLLMALGGGLVWSVAAAAVSALSAAPRARERLGARVARLPFVAAVSVLSSVIGALWLLYRSVSTAAPDTSVAERMTAVGSAAEVLSVGLVIAVSALLSWFHLYHRVVLLRRLDAEFRRVIEPRTEEAA